VMPTYAGKLKDKEITMLIAYFKSISRHAPQEPASSDAASDHSDQPDLPGNPDNPDHPEEK